MKVVRQNHIFRQVNPIFVLNKFKRLERQFSVFRLIKHLYPIIRIRRYEVNVGFRIIYSFHSAHVKLLVATATSTYTINQTLVKRKLSTLIKRARQRRLAYDIE